MGDLEFLFALLLAAAVLVRLADTIRVPFPIVLVAGGLLIGLIPGLPDIALEPHVLFLVFLPPLLNAAAFYASPRELWTERRALSVLVLGLALTTIAVVAVVAHELVDGLPWAAAFALGAIVAPTDPVAAIATFRSAGVPHEVRLLVEGEAMLNDAIGLTALRVALSAFTGAAFDALDATTDFLVVAAGGIVVGALVGWLEVQVLRRLQDRPVAILWTVLSAYGAYIVAEEIGVSGVLSVVMAGLYLGWHSHSAFDADTRLSAQAFWEVLEFTLNALLFILLGLGLPAISADLKGTTVATGLAIAAVVVVVRMAVPFIARIGASWRERVVIGWSGMRGAISLAAALSVPLDIPGRAQIVFLTVVVIAVTLVGQGLTMPLVLRAVGLTRHRIWSPEEAIARLEAAQTALDRLDELEAEGAPEEILRRLRELYRARFRMCQAILIGEGSEQQQQVREQVFRYSDLRRDLIQAERAALLALRNDGSLRPDVLRVIERDLDLEEARLRAAA